jgi:hypothetical protein
MKPKTVLKSLNDLPSEILQPEPARPMRGNPETRPADKTMQQQNQVRIQVLKQPGFAGYPHWGLNE